MHGWGRNRCIRWSVLWIIPKSGREYLHGSYTDSMLFSLKNAIVVNCDTAGSIMTIKTVRCYSLHPDRYTEAIT